MKAQNECKPTSVVVYCRFCDSTCDLVRFALAVTIRCKKEPSYNLLRHGPPRLAFASCGHALTVYRTKRNKRKVCVLQIIRIVTVNAKPTKSLKFAM